MAKGSGKLFANPVVIVVIAALVIAAALIAASQFSAQREQQAMIGSEPEEPGEEEARPTEEPSSPEQGQGPPMVTAEPTKGDPDAPVTIVEFAEFYCPFCARYLWETFPKVEREYIEKDLVKYEFHNLPVHGPPALLAAVAGECAHQQGRFWKFHDHLFETVFPGRNVYQQEQLDIDDLKSAATAVGLDMENFNQCIEGYDEHYKSCVVDYTQCVEGGKKPEQCAEEFGEQANQCLSQIEMMGKIQEDREELNTLITQLPPDEREKANRIGTPTFFINGHILIGAQPFENFQQVIERELQEAQGD